MKPRLILALLCAAAAFVILGIRYAPPRLTAHPIGDPVDHVLLDGFMPAERETGQVVRRSTAGTLHLPLRDGRGALSVMLRLRSEDAGLSRLDTSDQPVMLPTHSAYRHYAVLAPSRSERNARILLAAGSGGPVIVDDVMVLGRGGWISAQDLLALLLVAAIPGLLMVLTVRLPRDWAVVSSLLALCVLGLLPVADYSAWLRYGPLATVGVGVLAATPWARSRPTCALLLLLGAALRWYALAWGNGYAFHPEEQAIIGNSGDGLWFRLLHGTAGILSTLAGQTTWREGWNLLLIGRIWSATLGTALIAVVYLLGVHLLRLRWALLATAFAACAPVLVQQSHIAVQAQWITLWVALLLLASTGVVVGGGIRATLGSVIAGLVLMYSSPTAAGWLVAPCVALIAVRRASRPALLASAAVLMLLLMGSTGWASAGVAVAVAGTRAPAVGGHGAPAYIYPLFYILLWGLGPLLMQLGIVGWGAGVVQACRLRRERRWLPLLSGAGAAFAVAGRGPMYYLNDLVPLVPVLCLTAAWLLQTFSQRLRFGFGQRTLRLLAGTALVLALASSVGLVNVYRGPDPRVTASRWLIAHLHADDILRTDAALDGQFPLEALQAYHVAPLNHAAATSEELQTYAAMLAETDYFVTMLERDDSGTGSNALPPGSTRLDACTYAALVDGRLGFVERASFAAQPHLGSWTIDDRRADSIMRRYDHPRLQIFQKVVTPSSAAIGQLLRC